MRNKRKVILICKEEDVASLLNIAQKLEIKFIISSNLEEALRIIKRCGENHLSAVIADFNINSGNEFLPLEIIAHAANFFLPTLVYVNEKNLGLLNDLENFFRFSQLKKYPILKKNKVDWEKAIYELNFYMTR